MSGWSITRKLDRSFRDCFGGAAQLTPTGSGRLQDRGREAAFLESGLPGSTTGPPMERKPTFGQVELKTLLSAMR